jgi:hypothetical protein
MKPTILRISTLAVFLSVSLAGCGQQAPNAPEPKAPPTATATTPPPTPEASGQPPSPATGGLDQALTFVPEGTTQVSYINWASIKQYFGVPTLNSTHSIEERVKFFAKDLAFQQPMIPQGVWSLYQLDKFSAAWSWDATDLIWEATITKGDEQPISVTKFSDDFDLAPVLAHYLQGSYEESQYDNFTVYSRKADPAASKYADAVVFNTAVISEQHIFVMSSELSKLHAALDTYSMPASDSPVAKQVGLLPQRLGAQMAALVQIGAGACPFPGPTLKTDRQDANDILAQKASKVHSYSALAVGYNLENPRSPGVIVFHYPDSATAKADFQVRTDEAAKGSLVLLERGAPISKYLTLDKALLEGNDIVMRIHLTYGHVLTDMVLRHDMTFGACP